MATDAPTEIIDAGQYMKQPGFSKTFTLPATADHEALEVGYSDLGRQPTSTGGQEDSPPVVLFMPGMFASRFVGAFLDIVGKKLGVRVLTVDRPGMGRSTEVKLAQRVTIWVELVPKLLAELGIQHVSLVSHSAGTIYLLNTLYSCPDVLSPTRPYAALLAPFIDVKHSGIKFLQAAQLIPNSMFGGWNTIVKSINSYIAPTVVSSLSIMGKWLPDGKSETNTSKNRDQWQRDFGLTGEDLDTIWSGVGEAIFAENTAGGNSEARQVLKKEGDGTWGVCEDVEIFVQKLVEQERHRAREAKLKVKILFAEDDALSGKTGQRYMEACWDHKSEFGDVLDYSSVTVEGSDHDSLVATAAVLEEIVKDVLGVSVDAHGSDSV